MVQKGKGRHCPCHRENWRCKHREHQVRWTYAGLDQMHWHVYLGDAVRGNDGKATQENRYRYRLRLRALPNEEAHGKGRPP